MLKNMEFFIIFLAVLLFISTSCAYAHNVDDLSVNNDGNLINDLNTNSTNNNANQINDLNTKSTNNDVNQINELNTKSTNIDANQYTIKDVLSNANNENTLDYIQTTNTINYCSLNNEEITNSIIVENLNNEAISNSIIVDNLNNETITNTMIDENISKDDDASATFDDLDKEIKNLKPGDTLDIDKDYYNYEGGKFIDLPITIDTNNIVINGNGHIIDARNLSAIFYVTGHNIKIYNLTFIDGFYHNNKYNYDLSPIWWAGDYGLISDCVFSGNKAYRGGAIFWTGDYGLINNSFFESNFAYTVGGAIYLMGHDNSITNCIFNNSFSRLNYETIFTDQLGNCNFYDNVFGNETFTGNCLNYTDFKKYYVNGSTVDISISQLKKSCMTWVSDKEIDLIPILYMSIMGRLYYYNENIIFLKQYNGTDFILNFIIDFGKGLAYIKSYHFSNLTKIEDVFSKAMNGDYTNNHTLIKNVVVHDQNEYEEAMKKSSFDILYVFPVNLFKPNELSKKYVLNILKKDLACSTNQTIYKILNVEFAGKYTFNSKSTWKPSKNDFDLVMIKGNGSSISVDTYDDDKYKWADLNSETSILMVSDLTIKGFNMGIRNLGGACICTNVQFKDNRMDYWIEKDYGAGICNAGYCVCTNCTFSDNYCKHGAAIFNQGCLEIFNCTFNNNDAYGKGDNICNANDGIVEINGTQIKGSDGYVVYVEGLSAAERTGLSLLLTLSASALAWGVGSLVGSPVLGAILGGIVAGAVGSFGAYFICTSVYDLNFDAVGAFSMIVVGCVIAGMGAGAFGTYIHNNCPIIFAENEIVIGEGGIVIGEGGVPLFIPDYL